MLVNKVEETEIFLPKQQWPEGLDAKTSLLCLVLNKKQNLNPICIAYPEQIYE